MAIVMFLKMFGNHHYSMQPKLKADLTQ